MLSRLYFSAIKSSTANKIDSERTQHYKRFTLMGYEISYPSPLTPHPRTPHRNYRIVSLSIYLSFATCTIACDHYARECEFGILKKKKSFGCLWLNEECPKLLCSLGTDHRRRKTIPLWNSSGKNEFFRTSLYVWYLQYWALCDALVDFKLWAGVRYLIFL